MDMIAELYCLLRRRFTLRSYTDCAQSRNIRESGQAHRRERTVAVSSTRLALLLPMRTPLLFRETLLFLLLPFLGRTDAYEDACPLGRMESFLGNDFIGVRSSRQLQCLAAEMWLCISPALLGSHPLAEQREADPQISGDAGSVAARWGEPHGIAVESVVWTVQVVAIMPPLAETYLHPRKTGSSSISLARTSPLAEVQNAYRELAGRYRMVMPPLTSRYIPVTKPAASEASVRIAPATSSGVAMRPSGVS